MPINKVNEVYFDYEELRKDIVQKRMIDNRMSMTKAAEQIGISKATLSRIETGGDFKIETLCKVLRWLCHKPEIYFTH